MQIKRQNLKENAQLGQFCNQFGMDVTSISKPHKSKNKPVYKGKKKRHYSPQKLEIRKQRREDREERKRIRKKLIVCRQCGKLGH